MLSSLFNVLAMNDDDDNVSINTSGDGTNPFDAFGRTLKSWQGPIASFGLVVAAVMGVGLLVLMMVSGEQMRARIKKHLVVILICVILMLAVSYFVGYANQQGRVFGNDTILPSAKMYLNSIFPTLFN